MAITEFETDDIFADLNKKFANVSLEQTTDDIYKEIMLEDLFEYRDVLRFSNNQNNFTSAMKNIRRYLTQEVTEDRIQNVLDMDIFDIMANCLNNSESDHLKYETAWVVTNLAYGSKDQTACLIHNRIVDAMIQCFRTTNSYKIKSQTAWGLANISIDSAIYREDLAKLNMTGDVAVALMDKCDVVYKNMVPGDVIFQTRRDCDDVKDLTWSLSNLCRGGFKTVEYWEQYLIAFNAFSQCIFFDNAKIWSEACWGLSRILSNMFDNDIFYFHVEMNPKLYSRLITLIRNQPDTAVLPVLQTISNFTSAPNNYIESLLAADLLSNLHKYTLSDVHPQLRRNAFLTISNLVAGGEDILTKVVYNQDIMESVMMSIRIPGHEYKPDNRSWLLTDKLTRLKQREEWKILKEVLWVVSNIFALASEDCVCYILRTYTRLVQALASLLRMDRLPLPICLKLVDAFKTIMERTTQIVEPQGKRNRYVEDFVNEDALRCLGEHCVYHQSDELQLHSEILYTMVTSSAVARNASAFGLPLHLPGVRRIVHGFEDGDIRLIENAFTNIQL